MEQKTAIPGFFKVDESVVVNKDSDALRAYKKQKHREMRIDRIQTELTEVKDDIQEIKEMIRGLSSNGCAR